MLPEKEFRILRLILVCGFVCFASTSFQGIQTQRTAKEILVSEARVEDRVRSLTPVEVPELIAKATAEDIQAQCLLGVAYANGTTVPHNDAEAVRWLTRAASHGVAWVQSRLGTMYRQGKGVPQNYLEAVKWYRSSAEQHYPGAADALGFEWLGSA